MKKSKKVILGVDPGTAITGYSIIEAKGNRYKLHKYGVIRTSNKLPHIERLKIIHDDLSEILTDPKITEVAVEEIFFSKNVKTAISVAQARGVILLTAANNNKPVYSYTPNVVKQSLTGYGQASKVQIQEMVKCILKLKEIPKPDDAADAIAIGLCHLNSGKVC